MSYTHPQPMITNCDANIGTEPCVFSMYSTYYYRPQRSWGKVIFSEACVKNSVHREGWCLGPDSGGMLGSGRGVSRPTLRGCWGVWPGGMFRPRPRGMLGVCQGDPGPQLGVSRPTVGRGVQVHTREGPDPHLGEGVSRPRPGGVSQYALRHIPPSRRLLLRAVAILLECILVLP